MPCKRQALISSLNPYSLPFFIPLHFTCRRRPNPFHLFAHFSIAMFTGFNFTPFFYLRHFGKSVSKFIRMSLCLKLSAFDDIKYLLLVLLSSKARIDYILRLSHKNGRLSPAAHIIHSISHTAQIHLISSFRPTRYSSLSP